MTLQRINRVFVRDVRSWRGEHEFIFKHDRTVLHGPNGYGKSSLWKAIVLGLLYKTRSGPVATAIGSIGAGAGHPYVEVDFVANGTEYRIEKTFSTAHGDARFLNISEQPNIEIEQGDAAVIACRRVLTGSDDDAVNKDRSRNVGDALSSALDGQIIDLIMPRQGGLSRSYGGNNSIQSIGLKPVAEDANNALQALIGQCKEEKKGIRSSQRRDATGSLPRKIRDYNIIAAERTALLETAQQVEAMIQELNEIEVEAGEGEGEEATQDRIDKLRSDANDQQMERRAAEALVRELQEQHGPIQSRSEDRATLRNGHLELVGQVNALEGQVNTHQQLLTRSEEDLVSRSTSLETTRAEHVQISEWVDYLERRDSLASLRLELEGLETDSGSLTESIELVAGVQNTIDDIQLASDDQWGDLRRIENEIAAIKGASDAWSITEFSSGPEHVILIDGEEVGESPDSVSTSIEVRDDKGKTRLLVENTTSLNQIDALEVERTSIFTALSADGTATLNQRKVQHDTLSEELRFKSQRIEDLNARMSTDDRSQRIATLQATLDGGISEPESERPEEGVEWAVRLTELQGQLTSSKGLEIESRERRDTARTELATSQALLLSRQGDMTRKTEEIDAHTTEHGTDEEIQSQLAESTVRLDAATESARPYTESRAEMEEQKNLQAQTLQDGLTAGGKRRERMVELRATINDRRETAGLGELGAIEAKWNTLQRRITTLEMDENALDAILRALSTVLSDNIEEIRPLVTEIIRHGASYVFGREVQIELGGDGFPTAVEHVQGISIPFGEESKATKEQLNVIYRVALAGIIAGEAGHGLCIILDDPFGDSDVHRRERMMLWIGAQLDQSEHQFLLLTANGVQFAGFGHHDDIRQH